MEIELLGQIRKDLAVRVESDRHDVEFYMVVVSGVDC
jgi:hypothetical protein